MKRVSPAAERAACSPSSLIRSFPPLCSAPAAHPSLALPPPLPLSPLFTVAALADPPRRRRAPDPPAPPPPHQPPPPAAPVRARAVGANVEAFSVAAAAARPGEAARALGRAMSGTMGIELFRSEEMQLMQVREGCEGRESVFCRRTTARAPIECSPPLSRSPPLSPPILLAHSSSSPRRPPTPPSRPWAAWACSSSRT